MISQRTIETFFAEFEKNSKINKNYGVDIIANFLKDEPYACAMFSVMFGRYEVKDPFSAALLAISFFERIRISQDISNELQERLKNP